MKFGRDQPVQNQIDKMSPDWKVDAKQKCLEIVGDTCKWSVGLMRGFI